MANFISPIYIQEHLYFTILINQYIWNGHFQNTEVFNSYLKGGEAPVTYNMYIE